MYTQANTHGEGSYNPAPSLDVCDGVWFDPCNIPPQYVASLGSGIVELWTVQVNTKFPDVQ